jgi:hypothetical protein
MTPLRQRMLEDMQIRNLAPATQRAYVEYIAVRSAFRAVAGRLGAGRDSGFSSASKCASDGCVAGTRTP